MNELGNTPADKNYKPSGISKAEERALKAYPYKEDFYRKDGIARSEPLDLNMEKRFFFIQGYEQAEKDLGWISVKDRLPDTTEYVFTCVKMDGIPQCVGFHYYKDGKWWEGYEEDTFDAVEYWMQIPKFEEAKK